MNILNQSPANGRPRVFPAARAPSHHQDACHHLLPVALPSPASKSLRSSHPGRPATTPLGPLKNTDGTGLPVKTTQAQSSSAVAPTNETCKTGGSAGDVGLFQTCSTTSLGLFRSLMEEDKFSLMEGAAAVGDLDNLLFSPPDATSSVTLAVSVSSAVKLESRQMEQIAKKMRRLTGFDNVRLENTVDPSLIAGFVISYGVGDDHVIDLSVKGRLAQLLARLESSDQSAAEAWNSPTNIGLYS